MHAVALSPPATHVRTPAIARVSKRRSVPGIARLRRIIARSRRHGIWIAIWSVVGWVGTALAPVLADDPFTLMLLSPRALFVALASDSVALVPFVLLGTARLSVTDASYYIIGKRVPDETVKGRSYAPRTGARRVLQVIGQKGDRLCRWCCARPKIAGAFLFFRPNGKYLAVAGAYGVSSWVAGISSAAGTALFLAAVHVGAGALF